VLHPANIFDQGARLGLLLWPGGNNVSQTQQKILRFVVSWGILLIAQSAIGQQMIFNDYDETIRLFEDISFPALCKSMVMREVQAMIRIYIVSEPCVPSDQPANLHSTNA